MTTSSEDVLLSIGHVRYKKGDGTLFVMNQRIAWMLENKDTVAVSHKYADVKSQKISPSGKTKVQLQVVLHDGTYSTFKFVNPGGPEAQSNDRDKVKSLLQELLPKFKRQIDGELEMKSRHFAMAAGAADPDPVTNLLEQTNTEMLGALLTKLGSLPAGQQIKLLQIFTDIIDIPIRPPVEQPTETATIAARPVPPLPQAPLSTQTPLRITTRCYWKIIEEVINDPTFDWDLPELPPPYADF